MEQKLPLRFGRNEFAGAFGDIGTDVPLIVLLILTCDLNARSVLILFGVCQIFAGFAYRLPIPVQPLKAMAVIAIAQGLSGQILAGGGLAIGLIMLVLAVTGGLKLADRIVAKRVVRGLQLGVGLKLAMLALDRISGSTEIVSGEGFALGAAGFLMVILLRNNKKCPAALVLLLVGCLFTAWFYFLGLNRGFVPPSDSGLPLFQVPSSADILTGLVVLAIPQLPLSLGNAVLATKQTVSDLFPGQEVSVRKLGLTYSACNLVVPFFGGVPVCHGSGGLAGHYAFGARTGGSVIIYGTAFLICGVVFGHSFLGWIDIFPPAILGILLLFEGVTLMGLSRDMAADSRDFFVVLVVGVAAAGLPNGFVIAMIVGILLHWWMRVVEDRNKPTNPDVEQSVLDTEQAEPPRETEPSEGNHD